MAFRIEFSPKAENDFLFIIDQYHKLNPSTAERYYLGIIKMIEKLTEYPKMVRTVSEFSDTYYDNYRELIFESSRIIYRIGEETVLIIRIIDGRMLVDTEII